MASNICKSIFDEFLVFKKKKKKTKSKLVMICISYDAEHIYQTASIYVDVLSTQKGNTECSGKEATSLVSICTG